MSKPNMKLTTVALILLSVGCTGLEETGVRSVTFDLSATGESIAELTAEQLAALAVAEGTVTADAHDGHGEMACRGLPTLADGMEYEVELMMVDNERDGLPGMRAGHSEPDVENASEEPHDEDEPADGVHQDEPSGVHMESVHVPFDFVEHGCAFEFGPGDLGGHKMGGLRGLNVHLKTEDGDEHMVLTGGLETGVEIEGGAGHGHGV